MPVSELLEIAEVCGYEDFEAAAKKSLGAGQIRPRAGLDGEIDDRGIESLKVVDVK